MTRLIAFIFLSGFLSVQAQPLKCEKIFRIQNEIIHQLAQMRFELDSANAMGNKRLNFLALEKQFQKKILEYKKYQYGLDEKEIDNQISAEIKRLQDQNDRLNDVQRQAREKVKAEVDQTITGRFVPVLELEHSAYPAQVSFNPKGRFVYSSDFQKSYVIDLKKRKPVLELPGSFVSTGKTSWSQDGVLMSYTWAESKTAKVLDSKTFQEVLELTHNDKISGLEISPDGKYLFVGSVDGIISITDIASAQVVKELKFADWIEDIRLSGDFIFIKVGQKNLHIYKIDEFLGSKRKTLFGSDQPEIWTSRSTQLRTVNVLAQSSKGLVVLSTDEKGIEVVDLNTKQTLWTQDLAESQVRMSLDESQLMIRHMREHKVRLIDLRTGKQISEVLFGPGYELKTYGYLDAQKIFMADQSTVKIYNLNTQAFEHEFSKSNKSDAISSLSVSPDREYVAVQYESGKLEYRKISFRGVDLN